MARAPTTSDAFNAVAEPRRRDILALLTTHERAVGEIVVALEMEQPSVSKHLRVLKDVGLVRVRREGRRKLYRTNGAAIRPLHEWTSEFEKFWRRQLSRVKERAEAKMAETDSPGDKDYGVESKRRQGVVMGTPVTAPKVEDLTLSINEEIHVKATPDVTFEALLEQLGPHMLGAEDKPMPMKIEAWPGGRWYRDLSDDNGHLWAHVQAIKRPALVEFYGPLMMSHAVASNVQYRLSEESGGTLVQFHHYAIGTISEDHRKGFAGGWKRLHELAKARAEKKVR